MGNELKGAIVLTHPPVDTFVDADRPQPGIADKPIATGNPSLPAARAPILARALATLLQNLGAGVTIRPSTFRDGTVGVLGNRATATDAVPTIVVSAEQYNMMARLADLHRVVRGASDGASGPESSPALGALRNGSRGSKSPAIRRLLDGERYRAS